MKKIGLFVSSLMLAGSLAMAADPVYSVNSVGYMKVMLPAGYSLIGSPFNSVGGAPLTLNGVFGTNVVDSTYVFIYVPGSGYVSYNYVDPTGWQDDNGVPAGDAQILRDDGFWVYAPASMTATIAGEVPGSSQGTNTVALVPGYQLLAFAYPATVSAASSGLNPTDSDYIFKWSTNQSYVTYQYVDPTGWQDDNGTPVDVKFGPGDGFWYYSVSSSTNTWNQVKPYVWP